MTDAAITTSRRWSGAAACDAVGVPPATWYRRTAIPATATSAPIPHRDRAHPRALTDAERQALLTGCIPTGR